MAEGGTLPAGPLYLDDLRVGQTFATGSRTLDEAAIKAFAREYDPQPFHLDAEAAKHTFFGGLVASGWHTAAITMRLSGRKRRADCRRRHRRRRHHQVATSDLCRRYADGARSHRRDHALGEAPRPRHGARSAPKP